MLNKVGHYLNTTRFGPTALAAVALFFLLAGLGVATDLHGKGSPQLEGFGSEGTILAAPAKPGSFADLAKQLGPTVVNIRVAKVEKVGTFQSPRMPEGPFGEFFERFFKEMPRPPENFYTQGAGSGVIISRDGYILTNNHVVEGAKEVTVTLAEKQEYKARIVGRDPKTDLAVLKIDASNPLPIAAMGDSDQLNVGDWVVAIGNPFGLSNSVTAGIVSAKGRIIGAGPYDDFIQTDASINPGNSGGPLFNMRGEVVGINTAIIPYGQGIGFAVPINTAKPLIPQLVATGEVTRGYLGVSIQAITSDLAKALKLEGTKGALVGDVVPGSAAHKAGIQRGDVIVAFNDKAVEAAGDLPSMVAKTPVGHKATVTILRDGKKHQIPVTVGKLPSEKANNDEVDHPSEGQWGLHLQDVTPWLARERGLKDDHGVVVAGIQPGSPADLAGIRKGDIILEVNHQPANSVKEATEVIAKADNVDTLLLLVKRDRGSFFVALEKKA